MTMNNGIGPSWFPDWLRKRLTHFGSSFFQEASWAKHDEGYTRGSPSRWVCDYKFLQAMLRDARRHDQKWRILVSSFLAWFFWLMCRVFGHFSYNYKD